MKFSLTEDIEPGSLQRIAGLEPLESAYEDFHSNLKTFPENEILSEPQVKALGKAIQKYEAKEVSIQKLRLEKAGI